MKSKQKIKSLLDDEFS